MKPKEFMFRDLAEHVFLIFLIFLIDIHACKYKSHLKDQIVTASLTEACFSKGGKHRAILGKDKVPVRIREFYVPTTPLLAGESTVLKCHYELQGNETLYAVKWYKDMGEFFRYVPGSNYKYKMIKQPGVDLDVSKSNHSEVYLRNLGLQSLGNYTCQVSTDGPYFRCVQTTRYLDVVVPPSDGPVLLMEPEKTDFELGENVSILCNSGRGKPAPHLTWYINGRPAYSDPKEREIVRYPDNMESSSLILRFHLKPDVFQAGKVVLKCVASLHRLQSTATKEIIAGSGLTESNRLTTYLVSFIPLILYASSQGLPV